MGLEGLLESGVGPGWIRGRESGRNRPSARPGEKALGRRNSVAGIRPGGPSGSLWSRFARLSSGSRDRLAEARFSLFACRFSSVAVDRGRRSDCDVSRLVHGLCFGLYLGLRLECRGLIRPVVDIFSRSSTASRSSNLRSELLRSELMAFRGSDRGLVGDFGLAGLLKALRALQGSSWRSRDRVSPCLNGELDCERSFEGASVDPIPERLGRLRPSSRGARLNLPGCAGDCQPSR